MRASSMERWAQHLCLGISGSLTSRLACVIFLVSYGVGTRRGSEQQGSRPQAREEAVGVV
jgi:hypothetical protein